jgi:hypothetical protein
MTEFNENSETRKRKIAFEIIYYTKRIILCAIFFVIYYLVIYNKYFINYTFNYPIYKKRWILSEYIEFHDFLAHLFHSFFVISITLILFHRQIISSYLWLKKYSKQN